MEAFSKVVRIGRGSDGNVYAKIKYDGARLSITGVEGPFANGNCKGSCGQIVMHEWSIDEYAPGWSAEMVAQFRADWDRWHLNDMKAGNPQQEEWLRANPVTYVYPDSHYAAATRALDAAGLNPQGDRYGHKWHFEAVPDEVLERLAALPDTDKTPAWV